MDKYFLAVNKVKSSTSGGDLQKLLPAHIDWIKGQIAEGRVVQAGKWGTEAGMAILKAASLAEAEDLIGRDPFINSGLVALEVAEFLPHVEM
ncbi:MAG: YciI family protein [Alphaproteobacteria bacterium]|jgi:uncharacterized protein YciI|nr:hypothetical protein [Rhodospirillaceae bacterium]MDP6406253.1 YciI family protein [Alphaproteobacteria bacterium]MDP6623611.1 YciI family protein [Alphaproteobacteria bacterium]|tara:strand:+ start:999 stop:1274 length:276 start_codon:yes stop_codon:yes gene_type:complete